MDLGIGSGQSAHAVNALLGFNNVRQHAAGVQVLFIVQNDDVLTYDFLPRQVSELQVGVVDVDGVAVVIGHVQGVYHIVADAFKIYVFHGSPPGTKSNVVNFFLNSIYMVTQFTTKCNTYHINHTFWPENKKLKNRVTLATTGIEPTGRLLLKIWHSSCYYY